MSNLFFCFNSQRCLSKLQKSIFWRNHLADFDDIFFECSICNEIVSQCQICSSASTLWDLCHNTKRRSTLWRNHLAGFEDTFSNSSLRNKIVGQCQLSKMSVKTSKESPHFEETCNTWHYMRTFFECSISNEIVGQCQNRGEGRLCLPHFWLNGCHLCIGKS